MRNRPQDAVNRIDRIQKLQEWLEENAAWIRRQKKVKIIIHVQGNDIEVEIGLGKEKL